MRLSEMRNAIEVPYSNISNDGKAFASGKKEINSFDLNT